MPKIDIVVTYLNSNDPNWVDAYSKYKNEEIERGLSSSDDRQAFGEERTRDWNNLKYWLRGVELNCPWINKVFIITQRESQLPEWLNVENPKLRVVYHNEYIPKEFLPTFNSALIDTFVPLIEDLSETYINCDDDYFFLNPIDEHRFFNHDGVPYHITSGFPGDKTYSQLLGDWGATLDNGFEIEKRYANWGSFDTPTLDRYSTYHLPVPQIKSLNALVLKENYEDICDGFRVSRFRSKSHVSPITMYANIAKRRNHFVLKEDLFKNCCYVCLGPNVDFESYVDKDIVCFNDTELTFEFELTKEKLTKFLQNKFPSPCSFERQ